MTKEKIVYHPEVVLKFTEQEIASLVKGSVGHYDMTCHLAGQRGGLVWKIQKLGPGMGHQLNFGQVDLLVKVVELVTDPVLCNELSRVLDVLGKAYEKANA